MVRFRLQAYTRRYYVSEEVARYKLLYGAGARTNGRISQPQPQPVCLPLRRTSTAQRNIQVHGVWVTGVLTVICIIVFLNY